MANLEREAAFCELPPRNPNVVSRIWVTAEGDVVVTDLWKEMAEVLGDSFSENGETGNESD